MNISSDDAGKQQNGPKSGGGVSPEMDKTGFIDESMTELGSFDYSFQLEEKTFRNDTTKRPQPQKRLFYMSPTKHFEKTRKLFSKPLQYQISREGFVNSRNKSGVNAQAFLGEMSAG